MTHSEVEFSYFNPEPLQNAFIQGKLPWIILFSYLMFVKVLGPRIMKDRKPLDPKLLILTYNLIMVVANAGLCYTASKTLLELWPYRCDLRKRPASNNREQYYFLVWYFILIKYVELLDTVFFILRKKFVQASFFHVFHHSMICALITLVLKYDIYGFYQAMVASINSAVHVSLYLYYAISALRPEVIRKYIWCKKCLTTIQIMQFGVYNFYLLYSSIIGCGFDFNGFNICVFSFIIFITYLLFNFYFKTYK